MNDGRIHVSIERYSRKGFDQFIDILETDGRSGHLINQGLCTRFGDLARIAFSSNGGPGISLYKAQLRSLPHKVHLMERHPYGSQAFIPMSNAELLLVVASDEGGRPGRLRATIIESGKGVNILRNTWHGVLTPLSGSGQFAVVDWIGNRPNIVEHVFEAAYVVDR